jgi:tripartite-type tricarboxylate transporter receptor subunit TctC
MIPSLLSRSPASRLLAVRAALSPGVTRSLYAVLSLCVALCIAIGVPIAVAQTTAWPVKPVRFIVPFPPAGNIDTHSRIVGRGLAELWGQSALIENRPGAGGQIGMEIALRATPDGYTLAWAGTSVLAIGPHVYRKLPYDPEKDVVAVVRAVDTQNILVVHPSVPAKTLKELIAIARARKGGMNFASSGTGTISHLGGELFNSMAGTVLVHVPYKGSSPAMADLLSGQVDLMWDSLTSALPQVKAGKIRAIAVTGLKRSPSVPQLATMDESGLKGFEVINWLGVVAPRGVAREVVTKVNADVLSVVRQPAIREQMLTHGAEPAAPASPEEFAAFIRAESARWGKVVRAAGLQPE